MASLYIAKWQQFSTDSGTPMNGGKLAFTLTTTTTTNKNTYPTEADAIAGTNANANPVVLDSDGRSPVEIWISGRYRLRTYTSADVLIADDDPIEDFVPASSSQADTTTFGGNNSGTANALVFTYSPALTSYTNGQQLSGRILADNTAAVTVNGGGGVKSLVKQDGTALVAGDLQGPGIITFAYDSTSDVMRLQSADGYLFRDGSNAPARVDVASATTTNLDTAASNYVQITGTTQIDAITLTNGRWRDVVFGGILVLNNGASFILPGGVDITTAAGDTMRVLGEAAGVVRVVNYVRASGGSIISAARLTATRHYTASDTWTKPANLDFVLVEVVGGGGGGGGADQNGTEVVGGGGGGGGGYSKKKVAVGSLGATETVTIGAAGTAGAAAGGAGGAGGTSSFGAHENATGGGGGDGSLFSGTVGSGGSGGAGSGGDLNVSGGGGGGGHADLATAASGAGGTSHFGGGGAGRGAAGAGNTGGNYGGGGGGGQSGAATDQAGGAGAAGLVIVYEYSL